MNVSRRTSDSIVRETYVFVDRDAIHDDGLVFSVVAPRRSMIHHPAARRFLLTATMARPFLKAVPVPRSTMTASLLQVSVREYDTLHPTYPPSDPRMWGGPPR
jgi:hypothetical protein